MAVNDTNLTTLTLNAKQMAEATVGMARSRKKRAIFCWGQPGIAKSAVAQQVATAMGIAFADVRLSQMDPTDLRGIPYQVKVGNVQGISWSAPLVLPRDIAYEEVIEIEAIPTTFHFYNPLGDNGIHYCVDPEIEVESLNPAFVAKIVSKTPNSARVALIARDDVDLPSPAYHEGKLQVRVNGKVRVLVGLEEFNSAPLSVQAASYQLILDRRLGEYIVPEGVYMMAMGNRETDKGVTFKMGTPIMNRFIHLEMKSDPAVWLEWATSARIHPLVVGYIGAFKDELNKFKPSTAARGFQTPRTWEFVSDIMYDNEETADEKVLQTLIAGAVGDGAAAGFREFRDIAAHMPNPDDILTGRLTEFEADVNLSYALTTTLCYRLNDEVIDMKQDVMVKGLSKLKDHPDYIEWSKRCDRYLGFILDNLRPEIAILGGKMALSQYRLPFAVAHMKNFARFSVQYKDFIIT